MNGPVGYWARRAARERWRAAVALALLTVLATVVPLVAGAAARRTASSVDRMGDELRPAHLDLQFDEEAPPPDVLERLAAVPGVEVVSEGASILARPVGTDVEPFQSFGQGGLRGPLGTAFELARLDAGRRPEAADEVLLSRRQADELDLGVGDMLELETYTPAAIEQIFLGEPTPYDGPAVRLRVVGVGRQPEELTAGSDSPSPRFVVAPAFFEEWAGRIHWFDGIFLVRLTDGPTGVDEFARLVQSAFPGRDDIAVHGSEESARIDDAVGAQATALALLAAVALLTGALAVSQAATRLARSADTDGRALAALGFERRQLAATRAALVIVPIGVGVSIAAGLAVAVSGWFPNGPAGRVEPSPGPAVDGLVLLVGAGLVSSCALIAVLALRRRHQGAPDRTSRLSDVVGRTFPSVAATVGVQSALRRNDSTATASTRAAMVAIGAAAAGLVGSLVFAASLTRLVEQPHRYGWNWDYELALGDELTDDDALTQVSALRNDPRIGAAFYARLAAKYVAGRSIIVFGVEPVVGDLHPTIVDGAPVRADDEIALGRTTLDLVGAHVGGTLEVEVDGRPRDLRVVGQALFPSNENDDPAAGAVVTLTTLEGLRGSGGFPDVFLTVAPGADHAALRADLEDQHGATTGTVPPPVVSNLERVDQAPYLLAGYLALMGVAASAHALLLGVRERRGELATLRSLGFDRRQAATTVLAHSLTVTTVGVAVGLPVGLAVGRLAWRLVAGGLGFATDPRNPVFTLAMTVPSALLLALLLGLGPALWATRQRPATILRVE